MTFFRLAFGFLMLAPSGSLTFGFLMLAPSGSLAFGFLILFLSGSRTFLILSLSGSLAFGFLILLLSGGLLDFLAFLDFLGFLDFLALVFLASGSLRFLDFITTFVRRNTLNSTLNSSSSLCLPRRRSFRW